MGRLIYRAPLPHFHDYPMTLTSYTNESIWKCECGITFWLKDGFDGKYWKEIKPSLWKRFDNWMYPEHKWKDDHV